MKAAWFLVWKTTCALLLVQGSALADAVFTDTSEIHACIVRGEETIAATEGGVVIVKQGSSRTLTALDGLPDGRAWAIAQSGSSIFVGTDRGLAEIVDDRVRRTALDVSVRALAVSDGRLVAGTFGKGLAQVDVGTLAATFVSLPDPRVLSISGDRIGTMGGTFVRKGDAYVKTDLMSVLPRSAACEIPASPMPSNDVSAIAVSDHGVWIGTFDRGLALLSSGLIRKIDGIDNRIDAIVGDRVSARVWVGTARGLYAIDEATAERPRWLEAVGTDEVHALAALEGGGVVAGTAHGAAIVNAATGAGSHGGIVKDDVSRIGVKDGVALPSVTAVLQHGGLFYLGTVHGLYVGNGKTFVRLSVASGHLPDDWVTALAADQDAIYAGTYNGGVARLTKKQQKTHDIASGGRRDRPAIAVNNGKDAWTKEELGGGYVNPAGLALRDGTLFVATMDGLLSRRSGGEFVKIKALGRDVTAIAFSRDSAWIASRRGLLRKDGL